MTLLTFLRAIGRSGSFSAAARELGYSQAAVSQRVRRFEARIGMPLFIRRPRGVEPTEAGSVLLSRAIETLTIIESALQEVEALSDLRSGRVRIVAFPSVSATVLPMAIARLAASHPYLTVSFKEEHPEVAIERIREGAADIAITYRYEASSLDDAVTGGSVATHPLFSDPLYVVLAHNHPLAGRKRLKLDDLSEEAWIAGTRVGRVFEEFEDLGFTPKPGPDISDSVAAQAFVAQGLGIAIMPKLVILASHHPGIVVRRLSPSRARTVHAITLRSTPEIPAVAATMAALREVAGSFAQTEI